MMSGTLRYGKVITSNYETMGICKCTGYLGGWIWEACGDGAQGHSDNSTSISSGHLPLCLIIECTAKDVAKCPACPGLLHQTQRCHLPVAFSEFKVLRACSSAVDLNFQQSQDESPIAERTLCLCDDKDSDPWIPLLLETAHKPWSSLGGSGLQDTHTHTHKLVFSETLDKVNFLM